MPVKPMLVISDAPTAGTGLGRIAADLSSRIAENMSDVYRVATLGYGGINSRKLNHHHYTAEGMSKDWIIPTLPEIWDDWAGKEKGVILFISDPSRLQWFSRPEMSESLPMYSGLQQFLAKPNFEKWIYAPIDGSGVNDRLAFPLAQTLLGFDRILAYGKFGEAVVRNTLGDEESDKRFLTNLPHGINTEVFYPRNKVSSRAFFFTFTGAATLRGEKELIRSDETLIGCVCTNQSRKDFPLLLETVAILSRERKIRLWIHTDMLERDTGYSIPSLLVDLGLVDRTIISLGHIPDDAMAKAYSACDITIAPAPEGFGYPIAESIVCGTPVICGSYAGGADIAPAMMQVDPIAFRYEGIWATKRPVYQAKDWVDAIRKRDEYQYDYSLLPAKLYWGNLWPKWENYLRNALEEIK